ncbi:6073_t:CDS:2 [Paraglomus occultum]|uniref:6073_t:CDS:1 n=1 Tax=Paraglomus occultum TaxID=144539 RepID=A0A9N9GPD4_9GLOM|nr:6073_t:CDS:2 [Paraglomus occultum]
MYVDEVNNLTNQLNEVKLIWIEMTDSTRPNSPALCHIALLLCKARSLSAEIQGAADRHDVTTEAIVQKLQIKLKQLEFLHDDKMQVMSAVNAEHQRDRRNSMTASGVDHWKLFRDFTRKSNSSWK